jgi:hypothetical protein
MKTTFEPTRSQRLFHTARSWVHAAFCWVGLAKPSKIDQSVRWELERRGVDSVRALLASMSDGHSGTGRRSRFLLEPGLDISRGEAEDWLKEKDNAQACLIRVGTAAAVIAALPVVLGYLGWGDPPK